MSLKRSVAVVVVAVMVVMLICGMVVVEAQNTRRSRRGRGPRRSSTATPKVVVTNTTRYGESNVCKVCTTSTFQCTYVFMKHCPVNYTSTPGNSTHRGKRHADDDDPHHHHHGHDWHEWSNGDYPKKNANGTHPHPFLPSMQWCKYNVSKTCTESKCEIRCCDGSRRTSGTNSCKSRRGSNGKLDSCMNGGTLNARKSFCKCPANYIGIQCEQRKCAKKCQNGGQCQTNTTRTAGRLSDTNYNDDYCVCPSGTSGEFCETKKCPKDCKNNGTCVNQGRYWTTCVCPPGYSGDVCQKKEKEGSCPALGDLDFDECLYYIGKYECFHDEECDGATKCCRGNCFSRKCQDPVNPNVTCTYNNETYEIGTVFKPDACRICTCNETNTGLLQGAIECSRLMCPDLPANCKNVTTPPDACCPVCYDDMSSNLCGDKYEVPHFANCPKDEVVFDVDPGSNVARINRTLIARDCQGTQLHVRMSDDRFMAGVGQENHHLMSAASDFDGRGNFAECVFRIRVRDSESPKFITCPMNFVETSDLPASWPLPVAKDNVGLKTAPTSVRHPGQLLPPGKYIIDYWAEDYEGNVARCSFTVTIVHPHEMNHNPATDHPHPHPRPHPDPHHQGQQQSGSFVHHAVTSSHSALNVGLGLTGVVFVGLLLVFGYIFYRRYRRIQSATAGGPTVRMSSVDSPGSLGWGGRGGGGGGRGGGGNMESLPPHYGDSGDVVMSPPLYSQRLEHDMMAAGGGVPEAGELPSKSPFP